MKKLRIFLTIAALGILTTSCRFGRHTVIAENGNGHNLRIESYGKIHFNPAGTDIAYISSGGYLEYQYDDKHLKAENDGYEHIKYELDADGQKLNPSGNGKSFIADAVKMMIKKGYHSN